MILDDDFVISAKVYFAMSQEQADRDHCVRCLSEEFPSSREVYHKLKKIPDELCISKSLEWETDLCIAKDDLPAVMKILYPEELTWSYHELVDQIEGNCVWIIGFDD